MAKGQGDLAQPRGRRISPQLRHEHERVHQGRHWHNKYVCDPEFLFFYVRRLESPPGAAVCIDAPRQISPRLRARSPCACIMVYTCTCTIMLASIFFIVGPALSSHP